MSKFKRISIMLIGLLISSATLVFAGTGTITIDELRIRKEASTDSEVVAYLYKGNVVEIIEKTGEWYKIKVNNYEGYIYAEYVKNSEDNKTATVETPTEVTTEAPEQKPIATETETTAEQTQTVGIQTTEVYPKTVNTVGITKIYVLPLISSTVINNVEVGKQITINSKINNWSNVTYDGKTGWVRNYSLENIVVVPEAPAKTEEPEATVSFSKGYVNVESAIMREIGSKEGNVLTTLTLNTEVKVTGEENDWYKIEYGEYKGYIAKRLISETATITSRSQTETRQEVTTQTKTGFVSAKIANIRKEPSTSSSILTTLTQKTELQIIGEEGTFYKINIEDSTAYIAKSIVVDTLEEITEVTSKTTTIQNAVVPSSSLGNDVVAFAKQFLGYSYVLGGTNPSSGFDCRGFTYYVYNQCGASLPCSCSAQANSGSAVDRANLEPGDLLAFDNTSDGSIGHVGIYIGNGMFIHAANSRRGVVTDTIESGYYNTYYHSARRVI